MTEDFIYYLWKYRLIYQPIQLTTGEHCEVVHPGIHNFDAGPDFLEAQIRIEDTLWAGNVEIHVNASDWYKHNHHHDDNYDNIILHVVFLEDKSVKRQNGEPIPTIEINRKFDENLLSRYQILIGNKTWVPCENLIESVDRFTQNNWIDRVLVERLERRTHEIGERLAINNSDWATAFYQLLARNFGFKTNALPFELLARSLPMNVLAKHKDDQFQLEALIFGQAGLLQDKSGDGYYKKLKSEYGFLAGKYALESIDGHLWRFMRLRPTNFPTLRLSQFAMLIHQSSHLFSKVLEADANKKLIGLFQCQASAYWDDHYTFGTKSKSKIKKLGKSSIHLIMINTVIPFIFAYGKLKNQPEVIDRALKMLEHIPGESNVDVRRWSEMGMNTRSAFQTQALIELKQSYCNLKQCLNCAIGTNIIQSSE